MTIRFPKIVFVVCLMLGASPSFGQEGMNDLDNDEYDQRIDLDRIMTSPGESESHLISKPVSKDSLTSSTSAPSAFKPVTIAPVKARGEKIVPVQKDQATKQNTKDTDDSILSFNFLYYVIQKYKLQDIVD